MDRAEILAKARAARKAKAERPMPRCGDCKTTTVQNSAEHSSGRYWCDSCGWYPDSLLWPKGTNVIPEGYHAHFSQKHVSG